MESSTGSVTQHHIPDDINLQQNYCCQNFKSSIIICF